MLRNEKHLNIIFMETTVNFKTVYAFRKAEKLLKGLYADTCEREKQIHFEAKNHLAMSDLLEEAETILQNDDIEYTLTDNNE